MSHASSGLPPALRPGPRAPPPAHIPPGYYYDAARGRLFRGQAPKRPPETEETSSASAALLPLEARIARWQRWAQTDPRVCPHVLALVHARRQGVLNWRGRSGRAHLGGKLRRLVARTGLALQQPWRRALAEQAAAQPAAPVRVFQVPRRAVGEACHIFAVLSDSAAELRRYGRSRGVEVMADVAEAWEGEPWEGAADVVEVQPAHSGRFGYWLTDAYGDETDDYYGLKLGFVDENYCMGWWRGKRRGKKKRKRKKRKACHTHPRLCLYASATVFHPVAAVPEKVGVPCIDVNVWRLALNLFPISLPPTTGLSLPLSSCATALRLSISASV